MPCGLSAVISYYMGYGKKSRFYYVMYIAILFNRLDIGLLLLLSYRLGLGLPEVDGYSCSQIYGMALEITNFVWEMNFVLSLTLYKIKSRFIKQIGNME